MRGDKLTREEIIAENLVANSRKISTAAEIRLGILNGIVKGFGLEKSGDITDNAELLRLASQRFEKAAVVSISSGAPDCSRELVKIYSLTTSMADKVTLCKLLNNSLLNGGDIPAHKLLEPERTADFDFEQGIRIAYRKAHGADIAFEKFASVISDASAVYRDTFAGVCDSVVLGEADMCILPYENTSDGKLLSFCRLIESFDLKIAASCMVRSDNRTDETRYLLLSSSLEGLSELSGITDFEFFITDKTGRDITKILGAASCFDIRVLSIDTVRADTSETTYDIRISSDENKLNMFIIYLKLEAVSFSPLGLYAETM